MKNARPAALPSGRLELASITARLAKKLYLDHFTNVMHHLAVSKVIASGTLDWPGERRVRLLSGYWRFKYLY